MNVNPVKGLRRGVWEHSGSFNNCWRTGVGYKILGIEFASGGVF
jgi:hypothetical protein